MKMLTAYNSLYLTFILTLTLLISAVFSDACAQQSLDIRSSDKSKYSRLVFDWQSGVDYDVKRDEGALDINFNKAAQTNYNAITTRNIGGVSVTSNDPLKVSVSIPASAKIRHFKIGNRVVLDVYNTSDKAQKIVNKTIVNDTASGPINELKEIDRKQDNVTVTIPPPSQNLDVITVGSEEAVTQAVRDPNVITLSSTKNVGVAVFERAGYLWLVQDNPELTIPPVISGPEKAKFDKFEEFDVTGGKAYRMAMPNNLNLYGEGGGLLWRIVMTPNPRALSSLKFETREATLENGAVKRDLFVPMDSARKRIKLKDPLIGDEITVITAENTSHLIGDARNLVNMSILPSYVGFAFTSFSDDMLKVAVQPDGVLITDKNNVGIALSPKSDTDSLLLKDDIEQEELAFQQAENPNSIRRIFNFNRWQMGGARALEQNKKVLKVGLASKEGSAKVEGLITMAKLHLANNRGPEALGILRVAATELPGIEDTPEFIAIRGAANVLARKYDEAIIDFSDTKVKDYDELNYWKTAALAGLEDWQQADKTIPTQFNVLAEYPPQIKTPIGLMLAETTLRAGNTNLADSLLLMLEPDFAQMDLPEKAAWKYLQGEKDRQKGNPEQALKNWNLLLTGKDDYFRAKAGLSVTRMQLERQKITPAKAIDRLEGLRYAWRGDELETAINYRLGQIYIENKDYLKGLSVLRNAVSLSPNSAVSEEVTEELTKAFRTLFTDGTLNSMSPLDAVSIYEEFKELTPSGRDGDVFVQNLAERLADVDLLGRASALLDHQMRKRLSGKDKARVANRLASIHLLDGDANEALDAVSHAESALKREPDAKLSLETRLLKARSLSELGEASKALGLLRGLSGSENLSKLRADIAWNGGLWNEAANAFEKLIALASISTTRPPDEYQENLILNRSIALNLSGKRGGLSEMRKSYGDLMKQSEKARIFDLITRPRKLGILDNRESIKSLISEVDLFGDFLENYKASN